MNDDARILIVSDERTLGAMLVSMLAYNGYRRPRLAASREIDAVMAAFAPDLVLLDLDLTDVHGADALSAIRERSDAPVIALSARHDEQEIITILDSGADDYVKKPLRINEFLARVRAALRRGGLSRQEGWLNHGRFCSGGLRVDFDRRQVEANGNPVHLTPKEYQITVLLTRNAGRVLTHGQIFREVWGAEDGDSQVLRVNIANIRRKLEPNPSAPVYILTEPGIGYRMAQVNPERGQILETVRTRA